MSTEQKESSVWDCTIPQPQGASRTASNAMPGEGLVIAGWIACLLAIALGIYAIVMNVGVSVEMPTYASPREVTNLELLARRQMIATISAALLVSGTILISVGKLMGLWSSQAEATGNQQDTGI